VREWSRLPWALAVHPFVELNDACQPVTVARKA
jgi:hypothetical protein